MKKIMTSKLRLMLICMVITILHACSNETETAAENVTEAVIETATEAITEAETATENVTETIAETVAENVTKAETEAATENADEIPYTEAQTMLFGRPHLSNIKQPIDINYNFTQAGTHEGTDEFTDSVSAQITKTHEDGTRDLSFAFLSGERKELYPDINGFRGNPMIMLFLEWDVAKMEDTPGAIRSQNYFRNQIRVGFWKYSKVEDIEVTHNNNNYQAKRIIITPYGNNDADRELASIFADKEYEFILADEIPGEIYQISTKVLTAENQAIETTKMTYNAFEPLK